MADLRQLTRTFVDLADTLVDEFDIIELLQVLTGRCVELLGVDAAGVMLADGGGNLRLAAASSERARLLELFEIQNGEGPCLDSFRTGRRVSYVDGGAESAPWPAFAPKAKSEGFLSVHALPMRLRHEIIGALNLFAHEPVQLPAEDIRVAQAFADIATIAILQERLVKEREVLAAQLQTALDSRVVIEQAKGILAERLGFDMDTAFSTLRDAARRANRRLSEVARDIIDSRGSDAGRLLHRGFEDLRDRRV
ncbi:MAG: GAF and ANTAR domain-containing protein [Actinomycetota bacterium]|nr:GAF and ANTAR domain-containing protein [Actinomycetota bacterium]